MRVVPPPLCDRANFRQLLTVDVASNSISALPFGIFMWLLQLQNMILDHNKLTAFPFCLFLRTHVVIHDAPPSPLHPHSLANLTAFPFARPLKISCQHNPLKDPFVRMARGDAAGLFAVPQSLNPLTFYGASPDISAVWLHFRLQVCEALWAIVHTGILNLEAQGLQVSL